MNALTQIGNVFIAVVTFLVALVLDYFVITGLNPIAASITDTQIRTVAYGGIFMLVVTITIVAPLLAIISRPTPSA